jgi:hypothetical protein
MGRVLGIAAALISLPVALAITFAALMFFVATFTQNILFVLLALPLSGMAVILWVVFVGAIDDVING